MRDSYFLLFFQLLAHISIIPLIIYGQWYHFFAVFIVYFITGCFGMTMTFHRLLSHKSWNPPAWFEKFGTLVGSYGLTGSSIAWVAIHREHHHYTDKEKDPHSPEHHGFVRVQWLSMFDKVNPRYSAHLIKNQFHLWLHKNYFILHSIIFVSLLILDPMILISCYLAPAAILWNMGSFVNTLNHMIGYRNHDTNDKSTNIYWLGYLMWGEGWHNNHHAYPNDAKFKNKWWEFDVGWFFIKLLNKNE